MKTLLTRLVLPMSALTFSLLLTSCSKDDAGGANYDALLPDSPEGVDSASKAHDFELVEFDGFVNISSPIVEGLSHEGIVVTESGIEVPVFRTSELAVSKKPIQEGEQTGAGQPATRLESKSEGGDKPQPEAEGRSR